MASLIGRTAEEEVALGRDLLDAMYRDTVSYSNTRTVTTGSDRFLVLSTDFKYGGGNRKAIVVQEVIVGWREVCGKGIWNASAPNARRGGDHTKPAGLQ